MAKYKTEAERRAARKAVMKRYRQSPNGRAKSKEHNQLYRKQHSERLRTYRKERYQANIESEQLKNRTRGRRVREEVIREYGGKCVCCGETEIAFLGIDHVDGKGAQHRREIKCNGGSGTYLWLKRMGFPKENFQILCHNCNMAKQFYGICPHQKGGK